MKSTRSFSSSFVYSLGAITAMALLFVAPTWAQHSLPKVTPPDGVAAPSAPVPASMQKSVQVMVELSDAPAAATWATMLKQAQAAADTQYNYALQHPNLKSSKAVLNKPQRAQITASQAKQVKTIAQGLDSKQRAIVTSLTGGNIGGQVLFRTQIAYNGIAMVVNPNKISAIQAMQGVKAVHPMNPKIPAAAFSDIDFLGTRGLWTKDGLAGNVGDGVAVADIDTGLDYYHTNFNGGGTYPSCDHATCDGFGNGTVKAPVGYDFAGDNYNANGTGAQLTPVPDPDPFDCNGHGTATASLIAGYGINNDGSTYSGSYNASLPSISSLKCAPGLAPRASLVPLRVFGCAGSTNLVTEALEWIMGYNLNAAVAGYPPKTKNVPFIHVVNMSLGANEGFADDADDVAAANLASSGVIICSAAGNAGDSYYIHSSPAAASGTLGVAATFNDQGGYIFDSNVTGIQPPAIAGTKFFSIKGSASSPIPGGGVNPTGDASGNLVYAVPNNANAASLSNASFVSGKIVLIDRGVTTFTDKVNKGLAANAAAVIIDNFTDNPNAQVPILMSTAGQTAGIDVMISHNDRNTINTAAGGFNAVTGVPVNPTSVSINNDGGAQVIPALAVPDTIPTYSSRGPRLPDSATKPDISAPAEVVGVAQPFTGNGIENFNGTSSATPHVAGEMALLRELHPSWSVQELNALACNTATHDLFTTTAHTTLYGVGRIGAGRIDLTNAANAGVVAFNGTDANLLGVSFGPVDVPVEGTTTLTKTINVENKGVTNVTYNTSVTNNPGVTGAAFTLSTANFTVNAGSSTTVTVTFTGTGSSLKHVREASVASTQSGVGRQWLTEAGGYAVFTPTDSSPTLRVELYAAPRPSATMHATTSNFVPTSANTGSFAINLSGTNVNTGATSTDVRSLVKALELQYQSQFVGQPNPPTDRNIIKLAGVTSDYLNHSAGADKSNTEIMFGVDRFGSSAVPDAAGADTEIFFDTNPADVGNTFNPNFAMFLGNLGQDSGINLAGLENVFFSISVNLSSHVLIAEDFTNGLAGNSVDTNIYNNTGVIMPVFATDIGLVGPSGTGNTQFQYQVVTFDRNGNEVDQSSVLFYDLANPGLDVDNSLAAASTKIPSGSFLEPFWYQDISTNSIPANWNATGVLADGSIGVWLFHTHDADGTRSDVVNFLKPTISSFTPTSAHTGDFITISGANFNSGTTVTFFHNVVATNVNVITSSTISVQVPAAAASGPIKVSNAAGSSSLSGFTKL